MKQLINIFCILSIFIPFAGKCQSSGSKLVNLYLPSLFLIDIEPKQNITMNFSAPSEAGNKISAPLSNASKWLNYSSAIFEGGNARSIFASINQVIPGVDIQVQAANMLSAGHGVTGISTGKITLNTSPKAILTGIGGAFTGNGINNGHQLTYTLKTNTYANLSAITNSVILIVFTISE